MTTAAMLVVMGALCGVLLLHLPRRQSPTERARARAEMLAELEADLLEELREVRAELEVERARSNRREDRG